MKLFASFSEAIREGAKVYPPARGPLVTRGESGAICGTCAVGAPLLLMGLPEACSSVLKAFPYMNTKAVCPKDECHAGWSLLDITIILFEIHEWTREAIADWLETEEEKLGYVTLETQVNATPCALSKPDVVENSVLHR